MRQFWVYIAGSRTGTLYVGVTNDLKRRMAEHRERRVPGFTSQYGVDRLLHFEETSDVFSAIAREKQIKGWRSSKKVCLIQSQNPGWRDLAAEWYRLSW
jgi:putative endonuclease